MQSIGHVGVVPATLAGGDEAQAARTTLTTGAGGFLPAAWQSMGLVILSEIGDKTFFVAVLLSLSKERWGVFLGTFGALAAMSGISAGFGRAMHIAGELLPATRVPIDDLLAGALLLFFGIQTILGAGTGEEEKLEAEEATSSARMASSGMALVAGTFAFVFAAEWGDKSFLATIALAAAYDPVGVAAGAALGHALATGLAIVGGSVLGRFVSERFVSIASGLLFLAFAVSTLANAFSRLPSGG